MTLREAKYWIEQLDLFGMLFSGIFIGSAFSLGKIRLFLLFFGLIGILTTITLMNYIKKKHNLK